MATSSFLRITLRDAADVASSGRSPIVPRRGRPARRPRSRSPRRDDGLSRCASSQVDHRARAGDGARGRPCARWFIATSPAHRARRTRWCVPVHSGTASPASRRGRSRLAIPRRRDGRFALGDRVEHAPHARKRMDPRGRRRRRSARNRSGSTPSRRTTSSRGEIRPATTPQTDRRACAFRSTAWTRIPPLPLAERATPPHLRTDPTSTPRSTAAGPGPPTDVPGGRIPAARPRQ